MVGVLNHASKTIQIYACNLQLPQLCDQRSGTVFSYAALCRCLRVYPLKTRRTRRRFFISSVDARELLEFERQEANRGYVAAEDAFWLVEEDYKDEAFA